MKFDGLSPEWAVDVGRRFNEYAGDRIPTVDDLWVTSAALLARYRIRDQWMAMRAPLDRDPTSWREPLESGGFASNLLHTLHSPDDLEWTDTDGYRWWGTAPDDGWAALGDEERVLTLR